MIPQSCVLGTTWTGWKDSIAHHWLTAIQTQARKSKLKTKGDPTLLFQTATGVAETFIFTKSEKPRTCYFTSAFLLKLSVRGLKRLFSELIWPPFCSTSIQAKPLSPQKRCNKIYVAYWIARMFLLYRQTCYGTSFLAWQVVHTTANEFPQIKNVNVTSQEN